MKRKGRRRPRCAETAFPVPRGHRAQAVLREALSCGPSRGKGHPARSSRPCRGSTASSGRPPHAARPASGRRGPHESGLVRMPVRSAPSGGDRGKAGKAEEAGLPPEEGPGMGRAQAVPPGIPCRRRALSAGRPPLRAPGSQPRPPAAGLRRSALGGPFLRARVEIGRLYPDTHCKPRSSTYNRLKRHDCPWRLHAFPHCGDAPSHGAAGRGSGKGLRRAPARKGRAGVGRLPPPLAARQGEGPIPGANGTASRFFKAIPKVGITVGEPRKADSPGFFMAGRAAVPGGPGLAARSLLRPGHAWRRSEMVCLHLIQPLRAGRTFPPRLAVAARVRPRAAWP